MLPRAMHLYFCSSRTSRSWWITQSTQHHRRGCNKTMFLVWPKKVFLANVGRHFLKSNMLGRHFCPNFHRDFAQIFHKSTLLGVRLHPLQPRLLHHCVPNGNLTHRQTRLVWIRCSSDLLNMSNWGFSLNTNQSPGSRDERSVSVKFFSASPV